MAKEDLKDVRTGFSKELYGMDKKLEDIYSTRKQGLIARDILKRASVLDDKGVIRKRYLSMDNELKKR